MFVAISHIRVKPEIADLLEASFQDRRHLVDSFDGFLELRFLREEGKREHFVGVFRFRDKGSFLRYMRSEMHRISHDSTDVRISHAILSNSLEFFTESAS